MSDCEALNNICLCSNWSYEKETRLSNNLPTSKVYLSIFFLFLERIFLSKSIVIFLLKIMQNSCYAKKKRLPTLCISLGFFTGIDRPTLFCYVNVYSTQKTKEVKWLGCTILQRPRKEGKSIPHALHYNKFTNS